MRSLDAPGSAKSTRKPEPRHQKLVTDLASSRGVKGCLQHFLRHRQWINDRHLELCRISSPTFFEEKRAEWMAGQFRTLGWDAKLDRAGNVVAYPDSNREGPFVAMTAHLDTVLAPRKETEVHIGNNGRFHGPGVSDNGAGLSALLAFASCWKAVTPEKDLPRSSEASLVIIANVGEEG